MELIHERCAGLDVHKETVVASIRIAEGKKPKRETETFSTTTKGLLRLGDWLMERGVTHAVMESTGVYWKPVWQVLESFVDLSLANASEVKNLPGRKSDVSDAEWLADLLAHGLLRRSFVPDRPLEEMRELTRTRTQTVREVTRHAQRIDKLLQGANIKLRSVLSGVLIESGKAILQAMANGERDPKKLADLAKGKARNKRARLEEALDGFVTDHHCFLLRQHLDMVDNLEGMIAALEERIEEVMRPFGQAAKHLETIPGVAKTSARIIIAEVGVDMSRFPTAGHLVSWAGLCPQMDESAGKRRSTKIRKGNPWLKTTLVQCALAAIRSPGYLRARYHRVRSRAGNKKAKIAVARAILVAVYAMLSKDQPYRDLGETFLEERDRDRIARGLTRRLKRLGYEVELRPAA